MHVIDGTTLAATLRSALAAQVKTLSIPPTLAVLLVGDDRASHLYVDLKEKAAQEIGILTEVVRLPASSSLETILAQIQAWNTDPSVTAILVQLPLPEGLDEEKVVATIMPEKDVDGFHPVNRAKLAEGTASVFPPVHEGVLRLIAETPLKLNGATATILANSAIFADPLAQLLRRAGVTTQVMSPDALDRRFLATSDLVITAIGRLAFLNPSLTKRDAVLIDVGTNKTAEGKTRGDIDFDAYGERPVWITPVPGGVGPMTVAMLLKNVLTLAERTQA